MCVGNFTKMIILLLSLFYLKNRSDESPQCVLYQISTGLETQ